MPRRGPPPRGQRSEARQGTPHLLLPSQTKIWFQGDLCCIIYQRQGGFVFTAQVWTNDSPQVYYVGEDAPVRHPDCLWRASCSRCVEHIGQVCVLAPTWVATIGATCCLSATLLGSPLAVADLELPESHDDKLQFRHRCVDLRGQVFSKRGLELLQGRDKRKNKSSLNKNRKSGNKTNIILNKWFQKTFIFTLTEKVTVLHSVVPNHFSPLECPLYVF